VLVLTAAALPIMADGNPEPIYSARVAKSRIRKKLLRSVEKEQGPGL
jgi:hypothetical protein